MKGAMAVMASGPNWMFAKNSKFDLRFIKTTARAINPIIQSEVFLFRKAKTASRKHTIVNAA